MRSRALVDVQSGVHRCRQARHVMRRGWRLRAGPRRRVYIMIDSEVMLVTNVAANALTVSRGALTTLAAAHTVGICSCTPHVSACETAASFAACDAATPDTNAAGLPLPVPWSPTAVRVVNAIVLPGLDNTSGEITLESITISYALPSQ